jgi:hypothetical protein
MHTAILRAQNHATIGKPFLQIFLQPVWDYSAPLSRHKDVQPRHANNQRVHGNTKIKHKAR